MTIQEVLSSWGEDILGLSWTRKLVYFFVALLLVNTVQRIRRWYRLRHIPGPWICGFTSLWLVKECLGPRIDQSWKKLVDQYGKILSSLNKSNKIKYSPFFFFPLSFHNSKSPSPEILDMTTYLVLP